VFIPIWLIIFWCVVTGVLCLVNVVSAIVITGARQQTFDDWRLQTGLLRTIKAILLALKQKELFVPDCYFVQADDYTAKPNPQHDGVQFNLQDRSTTY